MSWQRRPDGLLVPIASGQQCSTVRCSTTQVVNATSLNHMRNVEVRRGRVQMHHSCSSRGRKSGRDSKYSNYAARERPSLHNQHPASTMLIAEKMYTVHKSCRTCNFAGLPASMASLIGRCHRFGSTPPQKDHPRRKHRTVGHQITDLQGSERLGLERLPVLSGRSSITTSLKQSSLASKRRLSILRAMKSSPNETSTVGRHGLSFCSSDTANEERGQVPQAHHEPLYHAAISLEVQSSPQ